MVRKKVVSRGPEPAVVAKGIQGFGVTLAQLRRALQRLEGIVNGVGKKDGTEALTHRVKSILGYRRNTLRMARTLLAQFAVWEEVLSQLED